MMSIPARTDRMPVESRKPRAGPLLEPDEVVALALNGVPFKWWREHKRQPPLSHNSLPVTEVFAGLRMAGYKIVPMTREDFGR